jgi:hypothetical protein
VAGLIDVVGKAAVASNTAAASGARGRTYDREDIELLSGFTKQ